MKSKRIAYRIYEVEVKGITFEIDGQNFVDTSKEWELLECIESNYGVKSTIWWDTFPTKRDAMTFLDDLMIYME